MVKVMGATLLFLAGGAVCARWIAEQRLEQRRLLEMAGALERMEGTIRWQVLPLPVVLQKEAQPMGTGMYLAEILQGMQSGKTLQQSWKGVFERFRPAEAAEILCRVELSGDAIQITGSLHLAAEQLRRLAAKRAEAQNGRERVCLALSVSLTGLLVVLLI